MCDGEPKEMTGLIDKIQRVCKDMLCIMDDAAELGFIPDDLNKCQKLFSKVPPKSAAPPGRQPQGKSTDDKPASRHPKTCLACGRDACIRTADSVCFFTQSQHPGFNKSNSSWEDSEAAKAYMATGMLSPQNQKPPKEVPKVLPATL